MSMEQIYKQLLDQYEKDITAGNIKIETAIDNLYNVCFANPKVPKKVFLSVCRQYDPNFGPVASGAERKTRAELTKKVREGIRAQMIHTYMPVNPEINRQYGANLKRWDRLLFRGLDLDQQKSLAELITGGDKRAMADYFYNRVLSKKDKLLSLLDMSDAELVENFFQYKDDLDLVKELQGFKKLDYTADQKKVYDELFDNMGALESLVRRIDMIANPYYADYPCERLEMSDDQSMEFLMEMRSYAKHYGEDIGNGQNASDAPEGIQKQGLSGPTYQLGSSYSGLRGFAMTILDQKMVNFVRSYGVENTNLCAWADQTGKEATLVKVMDKLNQGELIFVDIPGKGTKALHNIGNGFTNCKPVEASDDEVKAHMIRSAKKGLNRVEAANPFFLSVFTGSDQYKQMNAQHKLVKELMPTLTFPLKPMDYLNATKAIMDLQQSANDYLTYKKGQGLEEEDGVLIGRSANEKMRLAAAQDALEMANALNFLIQYQQDKDDVSKDLQRQQKTRLESYAKFTKSKTNVVSNQKQKVEENTFSEDELCKTEKEVLKDQVKSYTQMAPCKPSDAGKALVDLQKAVVTENNGAIDMLVRSTALKKWPGDSTAQTFVNEMAKVVLFDYVLKERQGDTRNQNSDTIFAGPVETALNKNVLTPVKLAKSPEFQKLVSKFTPARVESFLTHNESRKGLFEDAVRSMLAPVKTNGTANQPAQQPQAQAQVQTQAQPQPQPTGMMPG